MKFTDDDKQYVRSLYRQGISQRGIVRIFNNKISRRYVSFILFPERLTIANAQHKERRKDGRYYPGKDKWKKIMREHRRYKQVVLKRKGGE